MAFRMGVSKESVEGREVVPPGIYDVRFVGFSPKWSKEKEGKEKSVNLNAKYEIIGNPDLVNRFIFDTLNQNAFYMADVAHAFGVEMEQEGEQYYLPGTWDSDPGFKEDNPETWKYRGPLLGQTGKIEVAVDTYNNRQNNKVQQYLCRIENCAEKFPQIRHNSNLIKKT